MLQVFIVHLIAFSYLLNPYSKQNMDVIRYAAIGDSYTIGESVKEQERFPNLLVRDLKIKGVSLEIVINPAVTGWTTQDLLDKERPLYLSSNPEFATLCIGVNDWVQEVSAEDYRSKLQYILDQMLSVLPSKDRLLIVNIPDFGITPEGPKYSKGRDISAGLAHFNDIIDDEAKIRGLKVVDVFDVSKEMEKDPTLVAEDGLHPSAKEYELWEELIFPAALELLSK